MSVLPNGPNQINPSSGGMPAGEVPSVLDAALVLHRAGFSLLPIKCDGSKAPDLAKWKNYQRTPASEATIRSWFGGAPGCRGLAIVGGMVSGGALCIDFDEDAGVLYPRWLELVRGGWPGLTEQLSHVQTPNGWHVWLRCKEPILLKQQRLAKDLAKDKDKQTLIETRGEGGYALVPGCPLACHPLRRTYHHRSGPPLPSLNHISPDECDFLLTVARSLTREEKREAPLKPFPPGELLPGADYDQRGPDWAELLGRAGWTCVVQAGPVRYWRRPGKDFKGWSATTGYCIGQDGADLLKVFSSNAAPFEVDRCYGKFRAYAALHHHGDPRAAAKELYRQGYGRVQASADRPRSAANGPNTAAASEGQGQAGSGAIHEFRKDGAPEDKQADQLDSALHLVRLVEAEGVCPFLDTQGVPHVAYKVGGHSRVCVIDSREFQSYLRGVVYDKENRTASPGSLDGATATFELLASRNPKREQVYLRFAKCGDTIHLDLGDERGRSVQISSKGVEIVDTPGVRFRRPPGMQPLPEPDLSGKVDLLWDYLNLKSDNARTLTLAYLMSTYFTDQPQCIFVLSGGAGSTKSTCARVLRMLIDPHEADMEGTPAGGWDLAVNAQNSYLQVYNNISSLTFEQSNDFCRLSDGSAFRTRTKFTTSDCSVIWLRRPVMMTSIGDVLTRDDSLRRAVLIEVPPLAPGAYLSDPEFWRRFKADQPRILGAVLTLVSKVLQVLPSVSLTGSNSMIDFERIGRALDNVHGRSDLHFLNVLAGNRQIAHEITRDASPLVEPILRMLMGCPDGEWSGPAAQLLQQLAYSTGSTVPQPGWPKHAISLSGQLSRLKDALAAVGVEYRYERDTTSDRTRRHYLRVIPRPGDEIGG